MTKDVLIYGYEVAACEDQTCAEKLANAFDRRDVETTEVGGAHRRCGAAS